MGGEVGELIERLELMADTGDMGRKPDKRDIRRQAAAYLKSEPERLAAAHSEGRKEATAEIVAWLREHQNAHSWRNHDLADAIERQDYTLSRDGIGDG